MTLTDNEANPLQMTQLDRLREMWRATYDHLLHSINLISDTSSVSLCLNLIHALMSSKLMLHENKENMRRSSVYLLIILNLIVKLIDNLLIWWRRYGLHILPALLVLGLGLTFVDLGPAE